VSAEPYRGDGDSRSVVTGHHRVETDGMTIAVKEEGEKRALRAFRKASLPASRFAWEADTLPAELLPLESRSQGASAFRKGLSLWL